MGGEDPVSAAGNEVIEATGRRFDPGEAAGVGQAVLIAEFSSVLTAELAAPQLRLDTASSTRLLPSYTSPEPLRYTQTIDGQEGFLSGLQPPEADDRASRRGVIARDG